MKTLFYLNDAVAILAQVQRIGRAIVRVASNCQRSSLLDVLPLLKRKNKGDLTAPKLTWGTPGLQ